MELLLFFFFSSVEWLALLLLSFAMFKFQFRGYWGQIILTSIAMSLLSHFVFKAIDMQFLSTILQPPAIFLFIWQVFRVHIFYAGLITVFGYLGYGFIQFLFVSMLLRFNVPLESMVPNTIPMYIIQSSSIIIVLLIVWFMTKKRYGYTFVPDFEHISVTLRGTNLKLFLFTIVGYVLLAVTNFAVFVIGLSYIIPAISYVFLGVLLYYALKKEYDHD